MNASFNVWQVLFPGAAFAHCSHATYKIGAGLARGEAFFVDRPCSKKNELCIREQFWRRESQIEKRNNNTTVTPPYFVPPTRGDRKLVCKSVSKHVRLFSETHIKVSYECFSGQKTHFLGVFDPFSNFWRRALAKTSISVKRCKLTTKVKRKSWEVIDCFRRQAFNCSVRPRPS